MLHKSSTKTKQILNRIHCLKLTRQNKFIHNIVYMFWNKNKQKQTQKPNKQTRRHKRKQHTQKHIYIYTKHMSHKSSTKTTNTKE